MGNSRLGKKIFEGGIVIKFKQYSGFNPSINEATRVPFNNRDVSSYLMGKLSMLLKKEYTINDVADVLERVAGQKYLFSSEADTDSSVPKGYFKVDGTFFALTDKEFYTGENDEYPISVTIFTNPKTKKISFSREGLLEFCSMVSDVVVHEWMHLKQSRARNWIELERGLKSSKKYRYSAISKTRLNTLTDDDEIEAYSKDIATEIMKTHGNKIASLNFLRRPAKNTSAFLDLYLETFPSGHPVLKRVLKKTTYFLQKAA